MNIGSIARQQWRARIETITAASKLPRAKASPASNGGRGLKRHAGVDGLRGQPASPASNGGRGLKLELVNAGSKTVAHRPPAMAGAD